MSEKKRNPHIDAISDRILEQVGQANKHIKSQDDAHQFLCLFMAASLPVILGPYMANGGPPSNIQYLEAIAPKICTAGINAMLDAVRQFGERN